MSPLRIVLTCVILTISATAARAEPATALRPVAIAGQPAPRGGVYEHFSVESLPVVAPVNGHGQVAFFATLLRAPSDEAIFLASGSRVERVAADGDPVPGGGRLSGFGKHPIPGLNGRGEVAFAAAVTGGRTVEGLFVASRGRLHAVVVAGQPAPGVTQGTVASVDAPALNDRGDVAFLATIRRGRESVDAIYVRSGRALRKLVAQGDPAPGGGSFAGFGAPAINGRGTVSFAAVIEGPAAPGGIFLATDNGVRLLVAAGAPTPLGGVFEKFSERVALDDMDTVAFNAVLARADARGAIFSASATGVRTIAALGDAAPGGGKFSYFGLWPAVSHMGAVAFTASVDGGPSEVAAFVAGADSAEKVVGIGDALPGGGRLASFGLYPAVSMSPSGAVTFATARTATGEGTEGIFVTAYRRAGTR